MVAASDSRATFGDLRALTAQNDTMTKLFALTPHVVVSLAGTAEIGMQLMEDLGKTLAAQNVDGASAVMAAVRTHSREQYAEWFPGWQIQANAANTAPQRPELQMLIVGYDQAEGAFTVPKIYQLISSFDFAPMLTTTGFGLQGVPQYALYLLNRLYLPEATIDELKALAAYVITETESQDGKVGGPVQMATVTSSAGCGILSPGDVEEIVSANATRSDQLRSSFYSSSGASDD
jgi:20S proteasome alpha/beta subunit